MLVTGISEVNLPSHLDPEDAASIQLQKKIENISSQIQHSITFHAISSSNNFCSTGDGGGPARSIDYSRTAVP